MTARAGGPNRPRGSGDRRGAPDFEQIAEAIPHIVWLAAPNGETEYFNSRGTEYTGFRREANYGWDWLLLVHPDDRERARAGWESATTTESPFELEYRIRRHDGVYRWHLFQGLPMRDADGRILRWIGTATDIEDWKRLELELQQTNRSLAETVTLLETLQDTAPLGLGFVDREYRIVRINQQLAGINGGTPEEQVGHRVSDIVPELWPVLEPRYRQVLETGRPVVNMEMSGRSVAAGDSAREWLTSYYPVRVEGEVIGVGVVVVDITERRQAEEAQHALTRSTVGAIAAIVEARDPYTAGHQRRVGDLAAAIAAELGLDLFEVDGIRLAAHIHDIGKIRTPTEILTRPGPLRPAEYELVKAHSRDGHDIVAEIAFPWPVPEMILQHHERYDGSGYPGGLRGDQIVIGARIIGVADVVDAISSPRPYRKAPGADVALADLRSGRGTRFDPEVVDAFLRLHEAGRLSFDPEGHLG